eukprot:13539949-Alexandrium_andersonii.AAC.1
MSSTCPWAKVILDRGLGHGHTSTQSPWWVQRGVRRKRAHELMPQIGESCNWAQAHSDAPSLVARQGGAQRLLSLIHISEPTRLALI